MRFVLALLLAVAIPFNAVYAASASFCDVFEKQGWHGTHIGHHTHTHDHGHDDAANADPVQPGGDHNHAHVHPLLSWMLPASLGVDFSAAARAAPPRPDEAFVSALAARLERPPRHAAVA